MDAIHHRFREAAGRDVRHVASPVGRSRTRIRVVVAATAATGTGVSSALGRVREVARRDKDARFTALLHHVSLGRLRRAYWAIRPRAAPGVDGMTRAEYGQDLESSLEES